MVHLRLLIAFTCGWPRTALRGSLEKKKLLLILDVNNSYFFIFVVAVFDPRLQYGWRI